MANVNNPYGLKPNMRTTAGGQPQCETWTKAAAYAYAIYKWDPVTLLAGVLNGPANGITAGTTRYLGVSMNWAVLSVLSSHLIMCDPGALFDAQEDNSGGANIAAAKMGYNANLTTTATAGGGVTRDNSGVMISGTSVATTSSLDVRILSLVTDPNNAYGAYGRCVLRFNKHLRSVEITAT